MVTKGVMMKRRRITYTVAILVSLLIFGLLYYKNVVNSPFKTNDSNITFKVTEGEAFNTLLDELDENGVLKNKFLVKLNVKVNKYNIQLLPGTYEINSDISLEEFIKTIQQESSSGNAIEVTIPEGFTINQIADRFAEKELFTKDEFLDAINNYPLPDYVKSNSKKKYNLEGYLYPDTYFFTEDTKPEDAIKMMIKEFEKALDKAEKETGTTLNNDEIEELVIKASLVEREGYLNEERPLIASVINNRLKKDMALEFCSTVNYIIGYDKDNTVLSNNDIKVDSPYNTYKNKGLPVGAIASPGYASIKACLAPTDTDYLYFMRLYDQGGKHHFSTTYEEHRKVQLEEEAKAKK
ncbi:MAG: endolytic transglycosylase MltG [Clostridiaceae bacterium]|nr:endolytic transglycosylase MltG [Clostridiaceae bacterium]